MAMCTHVRSVGKDSTAVQRAVPASFFLSLFLQVELVRQRVELFEYGRRK